MDHQKGRGGCQSVMRQAADLSPAVQLVLYLVHSVLHIYEHTVNALVHMTELFELIFGFTPL